MKSTTKWFNKPLPRDSALRLRDRFDRNPAIQLSRVYVTVTGNFI